MDQNPQVETLLAGLGIAPEETLCSKNEHVDLPRPAFPSTFHGHKSPQWQAKKELPVYRVMATMSIRGCTYKEIAEATGYTYVQVSNILRQDFMRDMVVKLLNEAGLDPALSLLQSTGFDNVMKLIELRDTAPTPVALGATKELMDRLMGKAPQHIITEKKLPEDPVAEKARLLREMETMQKNLSGGSGSVTGVSETVVERPSGTPATPPSAS